ncbi:recombinase family protein [Microbacterium sp. EST19A]|uniref:recombinase family protein n=1 Tax=Microbacterium sp. EST19A TaxID=2862681 RepID=UPI001CC18ECF|nr:dehydrogenase [Microbacterium sp. EST19A]
MSETMEPTKAAASVDGALTSPLHLPHAAAECPKCFTELQQNRDWWLARPVGSRLVGLVVSREGMPSVVEQRDDLTRFGVPIEGFRHPAPDILESWSDRLGRLIATLNVGDVLVVANINALGRDAEEGARTASELRRHGIIVKVLSHDARHLADATR